MQELIFTPSTAVLLAVILVCAFFAIRRLVKRGMCDCNEHCGDSCHGCSAKKGNAECKGCGAADAMVASMNDSFK